MICCCYRYVYVIFTFLLMYFLPFSPTFAAPLLRPTVPLDGAWSFRMEPANAGEAEAWYADAVPFADSHQAPGAWEAQGYGEATDKLKIISAGRRGIRGWWRYRQHGRAGGCSCVSAGCTGMCRSG